MVSFVDEEFFYSVDVLYGGLRLSTVLIAIFDKKKFPKIFSCTFFSIFGHKIPLDLDPDPH
jgi:hypothetical protein